MLLAQRYPPRLQGALAFSSLCCPHFHQGQLAVTLPQLLKGKVSVYHRVPLERRGNAGPLYTPSEFACAGRITNPGPSLSDAGSCIAASRLHFGLKSLLTVRLWDTLSGGLLARCFASVPPRVLLMGQRSGKNLHQTITPVACRSPSKIVC
jgi:hypothetical protein